MTTDLKTLGPDDSVATAKKIFDNTRIHHIPVVENDKLVGLVSKSDYLFFRRGFLDTSSDKNVEEVRMYNYQISHLMTSGIAKMEPDQRINVALEIFKENLFHAIPVVDERDTLLGIVTTYDIIKHLSEDKKAESVYQ